MPHLVRALRRSRGLHALRVRIRNNIAHIFMRTGRVREGEKQLRRALAEIRLHPDETAEVCTHPLSTLAVLYRQQGMFGAAIRAAEEGLARTPVGKKAWVSRFALHNNLALVLMDAGEFDRAEEHLRAMEAEERRTTTPYTFQVFHLTMALYHLGRGDVAACRAALAEAAPHIHP